MKNQYEMLVEAGNEEAACGMGALLASIMSLQGSLWNYQLMGGRREDGRYKLLIKEGGPPNDREAKAIC